MIATIVTLALTALGAFWASPLGQAFTASYMNRVRQERAFARIRAFQKISKGSQIRFHCADKGGGLALLGGLAARWDIVEFSPARITLRWELPNEKSYVQLQPTEFEAGIAVVIR